MKKTLILLTVIGLFLSACSNQSAKNETSADAYYLNPILGGDYPDPTIIRDGEDYYMTHSAFDYVPGLVVFHSKDLVNWEPISFGLKEYLGSIWAPDIVKYKDKYYIYFTVARNPRTNYVVWADSPYGPWSTPIDLKVGNIDPCHVEGEDGSRWLFLSGGDRVKLADNGLSVIPETFENVYAGWEYPSDWVTECFCLEGPKVRYINGYYYLLNAQGGTAGPPTSHMVVAARSKSINGPWENSPYNPIIRTQENSEHWWSKGHGSMVDTPEGEWMMVYHAYENGYVNLGRQTLMEPLEWTADGWFKVPEGIKADEPIKKPIVSDHQADRHKHLNEFRIGLDWKFYKDYDLTRFAVEDNALTLKAKGDKPNNSSPLMFVAGEHAYEVEVEVELQGNATAGIVICYDDTFLTGTSFDKNTRYSYRSTGTRRRGSHQDINHLWLRLRNDNHVITSEFSFDGQKWERDMWGLEVSGYNHNTLHQFQSMLPGLFVSGEGQAVFKNFKYRTL